MYDSLVLEACVVGVRLLLRTLLGFIDPHMSMFGTVFILHIIQKGFLVLGSVGYLVLRIRFHSLVPLSK
jgi:hypothetical protein